ncbi:MAG: CotH kinase family protein, partial [Anaeroplasmataceae bacterium]|nr:CotH kinase family protein [Anaeroplasmataceae bacterium]
MSFEEVLIEENLGYRFLYYVIDGEKYASNVINLIAVECDTEIMIISDYFTFELPIININTFGNGIDSKINYTDMTFTILNSGSDLIDISGGIRLRGNSTRSLPKKPYRIKFDKKQSLFGLTKAKSWVLLADYLDPSGLHNYTALSLGGEMDGLSFTPTPNKVNVYLNGEYVGLYTLCEQVQENEGRINIEIEITEDMTQLKDYNFFISMDASVVGDEDAILDETYYYIPEYNQYFELKYPEKENFSSEEQFFNFMTDLKAYTKYLLDIFNQRDVERIKSEVNLYSLADFLIIDEIMGETDHKYKSFNMYFTNTSSLEENGKINFGPIWDYDFCLYSPWTGTPNESFEKEQMETIFYSNDFYKAMVEIPEFL